MDFELERLWTRLNEGPPLISLEWLAFFALLVEDSSGVQYFSRLDAEGKRQVVTSLREAGHWACAFIPKMIQAALPSDASRNLHELLENAALTSNDKLGAFVDGLDKVIQEFQGQTDEIDGMLKSAAKVREKLAGLTEAKRRLEESRKAIFKAQCADNFKKTEDAQREIRLLQAELAMLKNQPDRVREDIQELESQIEAKKIELKQLEARRDTLVQDRDAVERAAEHARGIVARLKRAAGAAFQNRDSSLSEIEQLLDLLFKDETDFDDEFRSRCAERHENLKQLESRRADRANLERELEFEEYQLRVANAAVEKADRAVKDARQNRESSISQMGQLLEQLLKHDENIDANFRSRCAEIQGKLKQLESRRAERARLECELELEELQLRVVSTAVEQAKIDSERTADGVIGWIRARIWGERGYEQLEARVREESRLEGEWQAKLESLYTERKRAEENWNAEKTRLEDERKDLQKKIDDSKSENERLQSELDAEKDKRDALEEEQRRRHTSPDILRKKLEDALKEQRISLDESGRQWLERLKFEVSNPGEGETRVRDVVTALGKCVVLRGGGSNESSPLQVERLPLAWREDVPKLDDFLVKNELLDSFPATDQENVRKLLQSMHAKAVKQREAFQNGRLERPEAAVFCLSGRGRPSDGTNDFFALKCARVLVQYAQDLGWGRSDRIAWEPLTSTFDGRRNERIIVNGICLEVGKQPKTGEWENLHIFLVNSLADKMALPERIQHVEFAEMATGAAAPRKQASPGAEGTKTKSRGEGEGKKRGAHVKGGEKTS